MQTPHILFCIELAEIAAAVVLLLQPPTAAAAARVSPDAAINKIRNKQYMTEKTRGESPAS